MPKIPQAINGRTGTWIQVFLTWKSVFFRAILLATNKSQLLWMLHMFIPASSLLYFRKTFYIYLVLFYLGRTSTASWNLIVTTTSEGRGYIFIIPILKTNKLRFRSVKKKKKTFKKNIARYIAAPQLLYWVFQVMNRCLFDSYNVSGHTAQSVRLCLISCIVLKTTWILLGH